MNNNTLLFGVSVLGIALIVYYFYSRNKNAISEMEVPQDINIITQQEAYYLQQQIIEQQTRGN